MRHTYTPDSMTATWFLILLIDLSSQGHPKLNTVLGQLELHYKTLSQRDGGNIKCMSLCVVHTYYRSCFT